MNQIVQEYLPKVVATIVATGGALVVNYVLPKIPGLTQFLIDLARHKASTLKNTYVKSVLDQIIALAGQKVLALENTEIQYLKAQAAAGNITSAELPALLAGIKNTAIQSIKADASAQELWTAALAIFGGNEAALIKWISDLIESHVAQLPPSGLQTSSTNAPPAMAKAPSPSSLVTPPPVPAKNG
jgi:hypothetical protein